MRYGPGQVWRWFSPTDDAQRLQWDELWVLLDNPFPNDNAWVAMNLETGQVDTVFPDHGTSNWEKIA